MWNFDIVTANEIGQNVIVMSGLVFMFTNFDEGRLSRILYVELQIL
jgi:hypothetical protein